jgi:hypothetical protein
MGDLHLLRLGARVPISGMDNPKPRLMPDYKEMQSKATEAVANAIAQYLHATAALMATKAANNAGVPINDAEIIARLDRILAKLEEPAVPLLDQLWGTTQIGTYLRRSADNVRKEIVCLPSFPRPIRLPVHGKAQALYKAREVIRWVESHQEKKRK